MYKDGSMTIYYFVTSFHLLVHRVYTYKSILMTGWDGRRPTEDNDSKLLV